MKSFRIVAVSFLMLMFAVNLNAADKIRHVAHENTSNTTQSLLTGLQSENYGLKTSSAYMLGELNVEEAVIPLMRILRSDIDEDTRIVAALALYKIGDSRGLYAIKQATRFDESNRVRKLCSKFYNEYVSNNNSSTVNLASK